MVGLAGNWFFPLPITHYLQSFTDMITVSNGHNITYFPPTLNTTAGNAHLALQSWYTGQN
jgi:hypothetical protein